MRRKAGRAGLRREKEKDINRHMLDGQRLQTVTRGYKGWITETRWKQRCLWQRKTDFLCETSSDAKDRKRQAGRLRWRGLDKASQEEEDWGRGGGGEMRRREGVAQEDGWKYLLRGGGSERRNTRGSEAIYKPAMTTALTSMGPKCALKICNCLGYIKQTISYNLMCLAALILWTRACKPHCQRVPWDNCRQ